MSIRMLLKWNADKIHIPRCWFPPNFSTILGSVIEVEQTNFSDFAYQYNYSPKNSSGCFLHKDWLESPYKRVKTEYMDDVRDHLQRQKLEVIRQDCCYYTLEGGDTLGHSLLEDWRDGETFKDGKWVKQRQPGHIVARYENGTYKASPNPCVHLEETKAVSEANRLAKENVGTQFAVLKEIYSAKQEKVEIPYHKNIRVGQQFEVTSPKTEFQQGSIVTVSFINNHSDGTARLYGKTKSGSLVDTWVALFKPHYKEWTGEEAYVPF